MSWTGTVPAALPLLFHNSNPWVPSLAEKNKVSFTFANLVGYELFVPGLQIASSSDCEESSAQGLAA
jgi:hypothetical protein